MFFSSKLRFNGMMIIIAAIPLVIFYQINKKNRLMIYVHKKNECMYYIIKALISILAITFMIYLKDLFAK
jgi:Trk-type K+ transport system membrane component